MSEYWEICAAEILSEHGVEFDDVQLKGIARDIVSCSNVEYEYTSPPCEGSKAEILELKRIISKLEARTICHKCGGKMGGWVAVGLAHASWSDCNVCNGTGWVN